MMSQKLVTIEISDQASLLQACDILHDARFDFSQAKFDGQSGTWRAVFIREFFEDPSLMQEHRTFIFARFTFPMAECVLELSEVSGYEVQDRSKIGIFTFNECRPDGDSYRFDFCENMDISFRFHNKPNGRLSDMRLLEEQGSMWAFRNPFRRKANQSLQLTARPRRTRGS